MTRKNLKIFTLLFLLSIAVFAVTGCSNNSEDNLLSSSAKYDVNFSVIDENEAAVVAADLILDGENKRTDTDGVVSFKKVNGKYDYEVSAVGYDKITDSLVVDGGDLAVDIELILSDPGDSEPGDEDDTTAPVLLKLYAVVDAVIYGVDNLAEEETIEELTDNDDCLILYFSEKVKTIEDFNKKDDFKVQPLSVDPVEELLITNLDLVVHNPRYLLIKVGNEIMTEDIGIIRVKVNESGRQKIFDYAGNMLNSDPEYLDIEIK